MGMVSKFRIQLSTHNNILTFVFLLSPDPLAQTGKEKKVFISVPPVPEDESLPERIVAEGKGTIWKHFLREENGTALMCKTIFQTFKKSRMGI